MRFSHNGVSKKLKPHKIRVQCQSPDNYKNIRKTVYEKMLLLFYVIIAGYGLKCHRALKATCELIGIKDLHVKVENSTTNVGAIVQGFFNAVTNQVHSKLLSSMLQTFTVIWLACRNVKVQYALTECFLSCFYCMHEILCVRVMLCYIYKQLASISRKYHI